MLRQEWAWIHRVDDNTLRRDFTSLSPRTRFETPVLLPRRWRGPASWLGHLVLASLGWEIAGNLPNVAKAVLIAAPHDRTADSYIGIAAVFKLQLGMTFLGKDSLFKGLTGVVMRWLGGIPVDREASHDVVTTIARKIRDSEEILLLLSPEGTRKKVSHWRTGFYHIAVQAEVPIFPVALDYENRRILIGDPIDPTGDIATDVKLLETFYGELTGPIRFS